MQAGLTDIFHRADIEHEEIYEACKRRQATQVVVLLSDHLAGAAIHIRLVRTGALHLEPT